MAKNKYKIVIVEDDMSISQMYKMKFELSGHDVLVAENGKIGLEVIQKADPDIVLMDLMMPEMTGDEALKVLRGISKYKDTQVMILTNVGHEESEKKLKGLNVLRYIVKADMSPKQIVDVVTETLEKKK